MLLYILTLKICYLFFKILPLRNEVLFITRRNRVNSIEFSLLIQEIKRRNPIQKVMVLNHLTSNKFKAILYSYIETYYIARSKHIIVDSYVIPISTLKHRKETRIIQIWHAIGAIKKFGHETINKSSGNSAQVAKKMKMHEGYNHIIAGSNSMKEIYMSGFNVDSDVICPLGTPTVDYLLDASIKSQKTLEIKEHYNLGTDKEIILYAPTFRKGRNVEVQNLLNKLDTTKYLVVVKSHPLDTIAPTLEGVIIDNKFATTDWLFVANRVISDYSAIVFEASILDLPQYHYVYDYNEYSKDPGLFMNYYAEMPGVISKDSSVISDAISNKVFDEKKSLSFKYKYVAHLDGSSTQKIIDLLFKG